MRSHRGSRSVPPSKVRREQLEKSPRVGLEIWGYPEEYRKWPHFTQRESQHARSPSWPVAERDLLSRMEGCSLKSQKRLLRACKRRAIYTHDSRGEERLEKPKRKNSEAGEQTAVPTRAGETRTKVRFQSWVSRAKEAQVLQPPTRSSHPERGQAPFRGQPWDAEQSMGNFKSV